MDELSTRSRICADLIVRGALSTILSDAARRAMAPRVRRCQSCCVSALAMCRTKDEDGMPAAIDGCWRGWFATPPSVAAQDVAHQILCEA